MIICAAIKDNRTGAVFGGIRHGFIYSAMYDAHITPPHENGDCRYDYCPDCRRDYWLQEVE